MRGRIPPVGLHASISSTSSSTTALSSIITTTVASSNNSLSYPNPSTNMSTTSLSSITPQPTTPEPAAWRKDYRKDLRGDQRAISISDDPGELQDLRPSSVASHTYGSQSHATANVAAKKRRVMNLLDSIIISTIISILFMLLIHPNNSYWHLESKWDSIIDNDSNVFFFFYCSL